MDEEKKRIIIDGEVKTKNRNTYRNFILTIIAITLIVIAIPAWYGFKLTIQANEDAKAKAESELLAQLSINGASDNISQAKNTLFEGGIVGILLNSFQKDTKWDFFIANNGKYVVDAAGNIYNPSEFLYIIQKSSRVSYLNKIGELMELEPNDVKEMRFRVQFTKNLGEVFETEYNHYKCSYSEIDVIFNDGTEKTINTQGEAILDYFEAYLQDESYFGTI